MKKIFALFMLSVMLSITVTAQTNLSETYLYSESDLSMHGDVTPYVVNADLSNWDLNQTMEQGHFIDISDNSLEYRLFENTIQLLRSYEKINELNEQKIKALESIIKDLCNNPSKKEIDKYRELIE